MRGANTNSVLRSFVAGIAVRFEPGHTRDVQRVVLAGKKTIYGFRGDVMGNL